jgi:hypothetical protein
MSVADYFHKSAIATSQVLEGYDERAIEARLSLTDVGVMLGREAASSREGVAATDLLIRLLARFYPQISICSVNDSTSEWAELALSVNPLIEIRTTIPRVGIAIGSDAPQASELTIAVGSNGWDAFVGYGSQLPVGDSSNPFGPGAAACIAAGNLFRAVMIGLEGPFDDNLVFSTLNLRPGRTDADTAIEGVPIGRGSVLVGLGAIGNGASWALGRCSAYGVLHLVDPQTIELSNLQRYVLANRASVDLRKVDVIQPHFTEGIEVESSGTEWATFVGEHGYEWDRVLVALDSARDRRAVQSSLPRWVANGWTQPGDLGVSTHPNFNSGGACLSCLYMPNESTFNEDRLIGMALGLGEEFDLQIRQALYDNGPLPEAILRTVAANLNVPEEEVLNFARRPIRELYSEGICGGTVLPLSRLGNPTQNIHVPLAHQSALAGVLLASRLIASAMGLGGDRTEVTRLDVLRPVSAELTQLAAKSGTGDCICQDNDYLKRYQAKYLRSDSSAR